MFDAYQIGGCCDQNGVSPDKNPSARKASKQCRSKGCVVSWTPSKPARYPSRSRHRSAPRARMGVVFGRTRRRACALGGWGSALPATAPAAAMLTAVRASPAYATGRDVDPLPRELDPEYACQEAAASFNAYKADGIDLHAALDEDADDDEQEDRGDGADVLVAMEAQTLTKQLELMTCDPATGMQRLREALRKHEQDRPPSRRRAAEEEGEPVPQGRPPADADPDQQVARVGGGPLLLGRPLSDPIGSEPTPEGDVIGAALRRRRARASTGRGQHHEAHDHQPGAGRREEPAARTRHAAGEAPSRAPDSGAARARGEGEARGGGRGRRGLLAQADAAGYQRRRRDAAASETRDALHASTIPAEPMVVSASGGAEAMVVDHAHQEHLRRGGRALTRGGAQERLAELGTVLSDPVATLAGSHIESDAACRECPVPSQAEYTAETLNEMLLFRGPNDVAITEEHVPLRTYNTGKHIRGIGEAFLGEKHRFEVAGAAHAAASALVAVQRRSCSPTRRSASSGCSSATTRCRQRAGRWPRTAQGCWLMKQHGRFNPRAEKDPKLAMPAIQLNKDRFGTVRHAALPAQERRARPAPALLHGGHEQRARGRHGAVRAQLLALVCGARVQDAGVRVAHDAPRRLLRDVRARPQRFREQVRRRVPRLRLGYAVPHRRHELPARHGELGASAALPARTRRSRFATRARRWPPSRRA